MSKTVAIIGSDAAYLLNFRSGLVRAIIQRGHNVVCIAPEIDGATKASLEGFGATVTSVDIGRSSLNPFRDMQSYRSLRRAIAEAAPDVVIPYTIKPIVWGVLAAHAEKVERIIPMVTGLGYAFTGGWGLTRLVSLCAASVLYRMALSKAHMVLFQNPDDLALFRRWRLLPASVPAEIVAGSGIDIDYFSPRPLPPDTSFLMISRFLKNKGIREYAGAANIIKRKYPAVAVKLVGYIDQSSDSIEPSDLDAMIAGGIEYVGRLADVRPAIAQASVYVLPSYREGTPRSSLEAMAMGRAVVTTDAPGCRETVIEGVNGFLVPVRDAERLAEAMQRFIEKPEIAKTMGDASRRIATEKYDIDKVNEDIIRYSNL